MNLTLYRLIQRRLYFVVAFFLILFESIKIGKAAWIGDFWTHAAVVKELSQRLFSPHNPIINAPVAHAFYSPYAVLVASVARAFRLTPIQALTVFAYINLLLFVLCFGLFCRAMHKNNYPFFGGLALIFILFLWGSNPPYWSGFYHFAGLHLALPYPSTFALSLSFLALRFLANNLSLSRPKAVGVIILLAVIFITHPTTAVFLFLSIGTLYLAFFNLALKDAFFKAAILVLPALLLCLAWPYFNVVDLLFGDSSDFSNDSKELYDNVLQQGWPALLALPAIFFYKKDKVMRFFSMTVMVMLFVFLCSYGAKMYGFARLWSNAIMFAQLMVAYMLAGAIENKKVAATVYASVVAISLAACLLLNWANIKNMLNIRLPKPSLDYDGYRFLEKAVPAGAVILSDMKSNLFIPLSGAKVIATRYPLYWVPDLNVRREAVLSFFNPRTSDSVRYLILDKYTPDYILVDQSKHFISDSSLTWLRHGAKRIYKTETMELLQWK